MRRKARWLVEFLRKNAAHWIHLRDSLIKNGPESIPLYLAALDECGPDEQNGEHFSNPYEDLLAALAALHAVELIPKVLRDFSRAIRPQELARAVALLGHDQSIAPCIAWLDSANQDVRRCTIEGCARAAHSAHASSGFRQSMFSALARYVTSRAEMPLAKETFSTLLALDQDAALQVLRNAEHLRQDKGILKGDIVLCGDGEGRYRVCEVTGDYLYVKDGTLMHRRPVQWLDRVFDKSEMSDGLRASFTPQTAVSLQKHAAEIERLLGSAASVTPAVVITGRPEDVQAIEDPAAFALEKHLEDFLVENWHQTEIGKEYSIYEEEGEPVGQQYPSDTGPIDILAISKNKKGLLVVELKKGRASDVVVGQVLRYMGYVKEELAEDGQEVRGVIIALEDDQRIRRALAMTTGIEFFRYEVSFKLHRA